MQKRVASSPKVFGRKIWLKSVDVLGRKERIAARNADGYGLF